MGNVLGESYGSNSSLETAKPRSPTLSASSSNVTSMNQRKIENPGTIENLHKKCNDIQPTTFEGAKIMLNKGLSNHFQISHTIDLRSTKPSGYRFGATYVGNKQFSPYEAYPILLSDIDSSGNLNANILHQFSSRVRCKFITQIQESKFVATQLTGDYRGDDFTASLTIANPNIFQNSCVFVGHYLQQITENTAAGTELVYQYGPNIPGGQIAIASAVGRYAVGDSVWSGTIGPGGISLYYYQKASDQLELGIEVETSLRMQESLARIGYQVDLPKSELVFRGSFDSNWNICGVLEKRLKPMPFTFTLSGRLNHVKSQLKLGCGLIIG